VLVQNSGSVELPAALVALVSGLEVEQQVPVQVARPVKLFSALHASVLRLVVKRHVMRQIGVRSEKSPFRTDGALQAFLGVMGFLMGVEVAFVRETFAANGTLERLLPRVHPQVVVELRLAPEILEAYFALMVLFVQPLVSVQRVSQREFLSACGTLELFRLLLGRSSKICNFELKRLI